VATVLAIDDDPDIRSLLALALALDGHTVLEAERGAAGIELLRDHAAALPVVILDVRIAGEDGFALLDQIRADDTLRDTAVMLCTVAVTEEDLAHGWRSGADAYLSKPFDIAALSALVAELDALPAGERRRLREDRAAAAAAGRLPSS
jgi:DNA-binding response OmpR family regulator